MKLPDQDLRVQLRIQDVAHSFVAKVAARMRPSSRADVDALLSLPLMSTLDLEADCAVETAAKAAVHEVYL